MIPRRSDKIEMYDRLMESQMKRELNGEVRHIRDIIDDIIVDTRNLAQTHLDGNNMHHEDLRARVCDADYNSLCQMIGHEESPRERLTVNDMLTLRGYHDYI